MGSSRFGSKISARWVVFSYATIAGCLLAAFGFAQVLDLVDRPESFALYGFSSLMGGMLSGLASGRRTILDSGVAALLVALSMALFDVVLGLGRLAEDFGNAQVPLSVAFVSMAAALLGGEIGERLPSQHEAGELFWAPLAALQSLGVVFTYGCVMGTTFVFDAPVIHVLFSFFLVIGLPLLSGLVTQLGRRRPAAPSLRWSSVVFAAGFTLLLALKEGELDWGPMIASFLGMVFLFGIGGAYAAFGSTLAYDRKWHAPDTVDIPHASLASARKL